MLVIVFSGTVLLTFVGAYLIWRNWKAIGGGSSNVEHLGSEEDDCDNSELFTGDRYDKRPR